MTLAESTPRILIIDPTNNVSLRIGLEEQYGLVVENLTQGQAALEAVRSVEPDLIVINASLMVPSAGELLSSFRQENIAKPVVLVGANGDTSAADFNYPHIVGWLNQPVSPSELALLIQTALEHPLPDSELVLAKRAELIDANQRLANRVQELQTLFELGKAFTSELDLEALLRLVVEAAVNLTGADESYLLLVDEASGDLFLRAEANLNAEEAGNFRVNGEDSIPGQVIRTGAPVILSMDKSSLKVKTGLTVYSLINVPVNIRQRVIGVLGANNRNQKQSFTRDDEKLLSALADWSAIAIQNAKLYAETRQFSRDLHLITDVSQLVSSTLDVSKFPVSCYSEQPKLSAQSAARWPLSMRSRPVLFFNWPMIATARRSRVWKIS